MASSLDSSSSDGGPPAPLEIFAGEAGAVAPPLEAPPRDFLAGETNEAPAGFFIARGWLPATCPRRVSDVVTTEDETIAPSPAITTWSGWFLQRVMPATGHL